MWLLAQRAERERERNRNRASQREREVEREREREWREREWRERGDEDLKGKADGVYGEPGAAGVVLQRPGEEGLGEKEAGDPEDSGGALSDPALHEAHPLQQVGHPGGQRLQGRVGLRRRQHSEG